MTHLPSNQISLIYNPHAGFGRWDGTVRRIANFWQNQGWEVMICPTARPGHATELAARAAEMNHGLVLAAGGDGTLNEVANGLAYTKTVLAPLPVGTGNSFAKELRMPRPNLVDWGQLQQASEALLQGTIQQMDLGRTGDGRYWFLWIGTGLDGFVVDQIEPRSKIFKQLGPAGYAAKALFFLPNFPTMRATVTIETANGHQYETQDDFMMISICNCRLFAGGEVRLNATAVMDDGHFEVWLFRGQQWPTMMRYVLEIGLENHGEDPSIDMIRAKAVTVHSSPPMPYHVDGEPTADTPFSCRIEPGALRVLVPPTAPRGLFNKIGTSLRAGTDAMLADSPN